VRKRACLHLADVVQAEQNVFKATKPVERISGHDVRSCSSCSNLVRREIVVIQALLSRNSIGVTSDYLLTLIVTSSARVVVRENDVASRCEAPAPRKLFNPRFGIGRLYAFNTLPVSSMCMTTLNRLRYVLWFFTRLSFRGSFLSLPLGTVCTRDLLRKALWCFCLCPRLARGSLSLRQRAQQKG
jgi:hypothetical protein